MCQGFKSLLRYESSNNFSPNCCDQTLIADVPLECRLFLFLCGCVHVFVLSSFLRFGVLMIMIMQSHNNFHGNESTSFMPISPSQPETHFSTEQDIARLIHSAQTVGSLPPEQYPLPYSSLAEMLVRYHGDRHRPALIYYDDTNQRHEYNYNELYKSIRELAWYLSSKGIGAQSSVIVAAHNHSDTIIQYCAIWLLGACVVPLNMGEDDHRLQYIIESSGSTLILCREEYHRRMTPLLDNSSQERLLLVVGQDPTNHLHGAVTTYCFQHPLPETFDTPPALDNEALIVLTSGTTGKPKGVVLTQRNILADCTAIAQWYKATPDTRFMCVLPMHHVNGIIVTLCTPLIAGGSIVLNRKFQTSTFFQRILADGVHIVSVVPTLLAFLTETYSDVDHARVDELRHALAQSTLQAVICGAGPLTCDTAERFTAIFRIRVTHGYGLSETTCYSCYLPTDLTDEEYQRWMSTHGFPSIGIALPVNDMAIHSPNGTPLIEGERGEIVIRGVNVMKGYANNPSANAETFKYGWFRSGDEGFYQNDEHGRAFFFITGRLKELIIRGGVNLSPLEIDEVLAHAPGVRSGICVGFDHRLYGEEVGAVIIPHEGAQADAILQYCQEHLPFAKAPKVIVFTDELPITSTGKYQRTKVKHLFSAWHDTQFQPLTSRT